MSLTPTWRAVMGWCSTSSDVELEHRWLSSLPWNVTQSPFCCESSTRKGALRSYGASLSLETEFASLSNTELRKLLCGTLSSRGRPFVAPPTYYKFSVESGSEQRGSARTEVKWLHLFDAGSEDVSRGQAR